jgi:hypothetical protein
VADLSAWLQASKVRKLAGFGALDPPRGKR